MISHRSVNQINKINLSERKKRKRHFKSPQQISFLNKPTRLEHGGSLVMGRRRAKRKFSPKKSLHVTLRSRHANGKRSLFRQKKLILKIMRNSQRLFDVKVYNYAICGNHIHLLVKGNNRLSIQNFFRVFAGHTAQQILKQFPLSNAEEKLNCKKQCKKNQRKFWGYLIYSRSVTWGWDFECVYYYIEKNILETLNLIAYHRPNQHFSDS